MDVASPRQAEGSSSEPQDAVSLRAWLSLGILLLLIILSSLDKTIIGLMVDPIKRDLGLTDVQFSLLQGLAFALFYGFASIPMGWLADRFSRHLVIFAGVTLWSIATATCGLAQNFAQLFVARLTVGAGEATLAPSSYAMLGEIFPARRMALAAGILAAGLGIGGALAFAGGGLIVQWAETTNPVPQLHPWQIVFLIVGLPGVLLAPLVFLIPGYRRHATRQAAAAMTGLGEKTYFEWLRANFAYLFSMFVGSGMMAALVYGTLAWTPAYMMRNLGVNAAFVGMGLSFVMLVGAFVGYPGIGWLTDRLHARGLADVHFKIFALSAALTTTIGASSYAFAPSAVVLLLLLCVVQIVQPLTGVAIAHLQMCTPPQFRARTVALLNLAMTAIGMSLGPTTVAIISERMLGGTQHLGTACAFAFLLFGSIAFLCFLSGRGAARRAAAARTWSIEARSAP